MINWISKWLIVQPAPQEVDSGVEQEPLSMPRSPRAGKIDDYSDTWVFISAWVEKELTAAREDNDSSARDALQTAALRGRIKLLKEILELPLPPKRDRPRPSKSAIDTSY